MRDFLKYKNTVKNQDRDFIEWHKGRPNYSIWAIEIDALSWVANLEKAKMHLNAYLLPGPERRPHVTILTCGFVENGNPCRKIIREQKRRIEAVPVPKFSITLGGLNSFTSSPYFEIRDPTAAIARIREILFSTVMEDRTDSYVPHMTAGLYNGSYPTRELAERIGDFDMIETNPVEVTRLCYFTYRTDSIFSPLEKQFQIELAENPFI